MRESGLFIDGRFVAGTNGSQTTVVNPATEEPIGRVDDASTKDVVDAIAAARRAFDEGPWPRLAPAERSRLLHRFVERCLQRRAELSELAVIEAGSTRHMADEQWVTTPLEHFEWWADTAATFPFVEPLPPITKGRLGQGAIVKEPVGVVGAMTPFNAPLFLNLWKLGPALAMGNTVVLKPSPYTPFEALILADVFAEVDLPPGVVNVVNGDVAVGEELTTNPGVDMISFTGSDVIGRQVMAQAAGTLKRVILELGGKSANIVFADANLDAVGFGAAFGFTHHCGQGCALPTRILVEEPAHDALVSRIAAALATIKVGDPADPSVTMGPLIREAQRQRVERYIGIGRDEGAEVVFGGGRPAGLDRGYFVEPTLFAGVDNGMTIAQDEIFGPVGVVIPFRDADDAVRIANDSRYGLGGSVWSADPLKAFDVGRRVRTGLMSINGGATLTPNATFGGFKHSGIGRELSEHGLHEYLELKTMLWPVAGG
jgi:aldehyde dehydrogenase (NAD+)